MIPISRYKKSGNYTPFTTIDKDGITWYHACINNEELGNDHVYLTYDEAVKQAEKWDNENRQR